MPTIRLDPRTQAGTARFQSLGLVTVALTDIRADGHGTKWATLTIGPVSCDMMTAYEVRPDETLTAEQLLDRALTPSWHGFIAIGGEQRRVSIDPDTWVLSFHECLQRSPCREAAHEAQSV